MHNFINFYKLGTNIGLMIVLILISRSAISPDFAKPISSENVSTRELCPVNSSYLLPHSFSISPITTEIERRIRGKSYPEACPIPLSALRYLTVLHIGFDDQIHKGELIVHEQIAQTVLEIFYELYLAKYPIEKIRLIDEYHADDEMSMAANNTSAFCFRTIADTDTLSAHSYGLALDINPLYNPFIHGETVSPASSPYNPETGVVMSSYFMTVDDYCVKLFQSYGFVWGGTWDEPKDYQHFEYRKEATR